MVAVRKTRAGMASTGYVWLVDGAVVDVPPGVAAELLRIPDGGFVAVPDSESDGDREVTEPDPQQVRHDQPKRRTSRPAARGADTVTPIEE